MLIPAAAADISFMMPIFSFSTAFHEIADRFYSCIKHLTCQHLASRHNDHHNIYPVMKIEAENQNNDRKNEFVSDTDFENNPITNTTEDDFYFADWMVARIAGTEGTCFS